MLLQYFIVLWSTCCSLALARPSVRSPRQLPRRQEAPVDEVEHLSVCGVIIDEVNQGFNAFYAIDVYDCLISVPFHQAPALRFIEYYNTTMQFQSTLAHLKSPPPGYQQPAFDFMGGLEELKRNVTAGYFTRQYDFEVALQYLVYALNDAHVDLYAGILSVFSFASPVSLVSASIDGKETPKVYFADDILNRQENNLETPISAVSHINDEPVAEYLARFASLQSVGMLEPHADWNELMDSPVQDIQGIFSIFAGASTFFPGETITFSFEDPSMEKVELHWLAVYNIAEFTGPLETPGDFYNFFVLGLLPASYYNVSLPKVFGGSSGTEDVTADGATDDAPADGAAEDGASDGASGSSWYEASFHAFPANPDVVQDDLGLYEGGILTGYFYEDMSTGVLSTPHFNQYGLEVESFAQSLAKFITGAKERKLSHIIIDLQKNVGGSTGVALLLFREFFPGVDPFAGSQRRSHELGNTLGSATTRYWQSLTANTEERLELVANEWVIATRINDETGNDFTSWEEYEGPRRQADDDFSLVERYDLKNPSFHTAAFDGCLLDRYLNDDDENTRVMWKPENVVILTDGTCSSACALFLELAKNQAGARTVVVGGAPKAGPMQAASGSRGARVYTGSLLDDEMSWIGEKDEAVQPLLPPDRNDTGIFIDHVSFNLRDQLRKDDTSMPLQFRYDPADCRLYFTLDNVYNMTALWHDVFRAAFEDPSICVEGSTEYASQGGRDKPPPDSSAVAAPTPRPGVTFTVDHDPSTDNGLPAGEVLAKHSPRSPDTWGPCPAGTSTCSSDGRRCRTIRYTCDEGVFDETACAPSCQVQPGKPCIAFKADNIENSSQSSTKLKRAAVAQKNHMTPRPSDHVKGSKAPAKNRIPKTGYKRPKHNEPNLCSGRTQFPGVGRKKVGVWPPRTGSS
ncbi:Peptidase S41 family protein ustP [Colletotrichum fructicola]|nr:Peptidase S41 family protein ustP [Colletotrichum fructicola]